MTVEKTLLPFLLCLALVVGVLTPTATAGRAKPRPDLTVVAVGSAARVQQGHPLAVSAAVRNTGRAKARATTVRFALSTDRRIGGDRTLAPSRTAPALDPRRTARLAARVTVPASVAPGTYWVVACADATRRVRERNERNNCRVAVKPVVVFSVRSSHGLIDADVAAGRIGADQGLVYKVYADYRDPRLPARYVGRPNGLDEGALGEVALRWSALSAQHRQLLRPFLVPPFYAGSHWTPSTRPLPPLRPADHRREALEAPWCSGINGSFPISQAWGHLDTTGGDVRVWWLRSNPGDAATAAHYVEILDDAILPALGTLMGTGPQPDGDLPCSGGTDALDVVLVDASTATTFAHGFCTSGTSASMILPRTAAQAGWAGADPYLAHEVMHAIQFAKPTVAGCAGSGWVREMTAQWVQDYVTDPAYGVGLGPDDTEHQAAPTFLDNPAVPLDVVSPPAKHDYSAYLLPQWVARNGKLSFVRDVWDQMGLRMPKQAIDVALPGGFQAVWDDVALSAYNRGPVPHFRQWDGLTAGAAITGEVKVTRPGVAVQQFVPVEHLAAQYLDVQPDPKLKELEVTHDKAGDAKVKVRAIIAYDDGSSSVVDLSATATSVLCLDDGTRRATSVVIVYSNADLDARTKVTTTLVGSTTCGCQVATPGPRPAAGTLAPVCQLEGNLTYTHRDDYDGDDDQGRQEWLGREDETGTLDLVLVEESSGSYVNGPGSTFSASGALHETWFRHQPDGCGDTTTDRTVTASGAMLPDRAFAFIDGSTGDLLLSAGISQPGKARSHVSAACVQETDDDYDRLVVTPRCTTDGLTPFYRLEPVAPGSSTYRISCTDRWTTHGPDSQVHRHQSTVSGTITLP